MYVCICRKVCDRTIQRAIADGAATLDEVARRCGAGTDCGSCHAELEEMLAVAQEGTERCQDCPHAGASVYSLALAGGGA